MLNINKEYNQIQREYSQAQHLTLSEHYQITKELQKESKRTHGYILTNQCAFRHVNIEGYQLLLKDIDIQQGNVLAQIKIFTTGGRSATKEVVLREVSSSDYE